MATNFSASRPQAKFLGPELRNRSTGGFGAAAGIADLSGVFQANRERAPKFDRISGTAMAERAKEYATVVGAEASAMAAGLQALGMTKSQKIIGEAREKAAAARAAGAKSGAMMSGIGSILGAGLGLLSDKTTKTHIERIEDALTTLRELKPVTFYYKEEFSSSPERMHHGFIAQDYIEVIPDATYYDESIGKMCIDTVDLIGLLVRGIQQLEARVSRLEAEKALTGVK